MHYMAEKKVQLPVRVDPKLLERVDDARGDVSRTRFVERALESALVLEVAMTSYRQGVPVKAQMGAVFNEDARPRVPGVMSAGAMVHRFKCRVCEFTAPSEKARCPSHGGAFKPIEGVS